jgi:ArsR family transcriptional regulator
MRQVVKSFKALSDKTKIRILKILQEKDELCVCEIMQALDISQSRASRNLGILKEAGFVKDRREGTWIYYSLDTEEITPYSPAILNLMKEWLEDEGIIQEDRERLKKAVKLGLCQK